MEALARLRRDAPRIRALYGIGFATYVLGAIGLAEGDPWVRGTAIGVFLSILSIGEGLIRYGRRRDPRVTRTLEDELESWLDSLDELDSREATDSEEPDRA